MNIEKHFRSRYSARKTIKEGHGLERDQEVLFRQCGSKKPSPKSHWSRDENTQKSQLCEDALGLHGPRGCRTLTALGDRKYEVASVLRK